MTAELITLDSGKVQVTINNAVSVFANMNDAVNFVEKKSYKIVKGIGFDR